MNNSNSKLPHSLAALGLTFALVSAAAACSSDPNDSSNTGGTASTGGTTNTGGTSSTGSTTSTGGTSSTGGSAPATGTQGNFNVQLIEANPELSSDARSSVLGIVADGPTPPQIPMRLNTKNGECELWVPWTPFCSTPCGTAICTADDTCTPYPKWLDVGTVKITGLGADLNLMPIAGNYQGPTLPYPPCDEGGAVKVESSSFTMETKCVAPLVVTTPAPIPVKKNMPVVLAWTPAAASTGSRVKILLDIAHHGGKKGEIRCDVADTGSFSIPEPLVTELVGLGLAGYPTIGINRTTNGADSKNPNIKVIVSAAVERAVDTGVISCTEDADCPTGKTCDSSGDKTCK